MPLDTPSGEFLWPSVINSILGWQHIRSHVTDEWQTARAIATSAKVSVPHAVRCLIALVDTAAIVERRSIPARLSSPSLYRNKS